MDARATARGDQRAVRDASGRHLSARFARVDEACIHAARDQVLSPALQRAMVAATPVRLEQTPDTGHTPFVTSPDGVASAFAAAIDQ